MSFGLKLVLVAVFLAQICAGLPAENTAPSDPNAVNRPAGATWYAMVGNPAPDSSESGAGAAA
ncbi:hypothetical protein CPB83DRAFT_855696 [Crepidotus variabilis]|uniref:Uncharacterized protein n=1 Tax=Crepidotus variabilis TaxID=179855 RepID=A0A9P6EF21_9AGAR|nr:hypothetical protein CPB83DRAFT_855696 [Crepidotus variabilis]